MVRQMCRGVAQCQCQCQDYGLLIRQMHGKRGRTTPSPNPSLCPHDEHFTRPFNAVFTLPQCNGRIPLEVAATTSSNSSLENGREEDGNGFQSQDQASIARRHISHFNGLSMRCAQGVGVVGGREYYTQHYANALMAF